ncbi:hypothetical protein ACTFIW_012692 [Dictyostelium discoideum]
MNLIENNNNKYNNNKIWLITGTSSGIGLELVKKLLRYGYKVSALTQIQFEKDNLLIVKTDIANNESVKSAVEETIKQFSRIDVLSNNAENRNSGLTINISSQMGWDNMDPGGFRTGFVAGQQSNFQVPSKLIDEYSTQSFIEIIHEHTLFIGSDSLSAAKQQLLSHLLEAEKWSDLSISTDY